MTTSAEGAPRGDLRRFKAYPAYKDSGVEWLGEIPAHWEVRRTDAFLVTDKHQIEPARIESDVVFHYSIPSIQATGDGAVESPSTIDSAKLLISGERLIVSKLNPRKGVVLVARQREIPTVASTEFVPFTPLGCNLRWAFYLMSAESTRQRISATVRSATRSHQRAEVADITKLWHAVPSVSEQRAIATFLDGETARIDALVAKKERLIALLQERRTALITRAVTKGLDPAVPMKDSGVEWLGEIPAHWEVKKLAWLTDCLDGRRVPLNAEQRGSMKGEYPYWGANSIVDYVDQWLFDEELVLLGEDGAPFFDRTKQVAFHVVGKIWVNNHAHVLRPRRQIAAPFLTYALNCVDYRVFIDGTTRDKLTQGDMNAIPIQTPHPDEQRAIAAFLDRETARIDALFAKVRAAITRLYELRTALISAAVTGKIDVREAAP